MDRRTELARGRRVRYPNSVQRRSFLAALAAVGGCSRSDRSSPGNAPSVVSPRSAAAPTNDSTGAEAPRPLSSAPISDRVELSDAQWRERLSPEAYRVLRTSGTERAFTGALHDEKRAGVYACAGCGNPLYHSRDKFDSGTGWPSFTQPIEAGRIATEVDESFGMVRTECHCARCGGHQGHIFDDGPPPTGERHCINSVSLAFHPTPT